MQAGVQNAKAEECTAPININWCRWVTSLLKKKFTSYLLPFLMHVNTSETT